MSPGTSGRELFQSALSTISTRLRAEGFVRSGHTFQREATDAWGIVNVQKSRRSSASRIIFTVNLGVASKRILAFVEGRQSGPPSIDDCHWRVRIGHVWTKTRADVWWTLDSETQAEQTLDEIDQAAAIAASEISHFMSDISLRDLWLSGKSPGLTNLERLTNLSALIAQIGPRAKLDSVIDELRAEGTRTATERIVELHLRDIARDRAIAPV